MADEESTLVVDITDLLTPVDSASKTQKPQKTGDTSDAGENLNAGENGASPVKSGPSMESEAAPVKLDDDEAQNIPSIDNQGGAPVLNMPSLTSPKDDVENLKKNHLRSTQRRSILRTG